jgi:hypothetical protein
VASQSPDTTTPRRRRRAGGLLAVLALGAVGIGLASVLLLPTGGGSTPGGPGTFSWTSVSFSAAGVVIAILAVGLLLLFLYMRFSGPGGIVPKRFLSLFLVYFLVSVSFLALVHLIGLSAPPTSTAASMNNTTTSNSTLPINGTGNKSLANGTIGVPPYSPEFWWIVGGAVVLSVVGFVVAILYLGRAVPEARGRSDHDRDQVGEALEVALRGLDGSEDPRTVLIALYAHLLRQIGSRLPMVETATPREIERACVQQLGIPPGPARELRTMFERARYSTMPLDGEDVERARGALRDSLAGLRAPSEGPP